MYLKYIGIIRFSKLYINSMDALLYAICDVLYVRASQNANYIHLVLARVEKKRCLLLAKLYVAKGNHSSKDFDPMTVKGVIATVLPLLRSMRSTKSTTVYTRLCKPNARRTL